ncbi:HEAT repeat domain-containing protein [Laceyella putida]|uniref:HEAT repeat domain-containing protein n=1 Tax=Laceyella putida TaxID=110101 RepID=A0ABW2RJ96_9BACL
MADHEKVNVALPQAEREFLEHEAWWEKEEPKACLPKKIETMLEKQDQAAIDEVLKFACLQDGRLWEWDDHQRIWKKVPLPDELQSQAGPLDGSWLWTLYITGNPLAQTAVRQLLSYHSHRSRLFADRYSLRKQEVKWRGGRRNTFIPFDAKYFRYVKAIFKLAEKKRDAKTWAVLAHRFDLERKGKHTYRTQEGQEVEVYSDETHYYLRRRCWRYLRKLGEAGDPAYVQFAVEVLLRYEDQDGRNQSRWSNEEDRWIHNRSYSHLWLFNHLLFHHSKRFKPSRLQWEGVSVSEDWVNEREEAFSELWDQHPEQLWRLFCEAKSTTVIQFAWRALSAKNRIFLEQLSKSQWLALLQDDYYKRGKWAFQWLMDNYLLTVNGKVDLKLLKQMLFHEKHEVRQEASAWFGKLGDKLPHSFKVHVTQAVLNELEKDWDYWRMQDAYRLLKDHCRPYLRELADLALAQSFHVRVRRWCNRPTAEVVALILETLDVERLGVTGDELLPYLRSFDSRVRNGAANMIQQHFEKLSLDCEFLIKLISIPDEQVQTFTTQFLSARRLWVVPFYPTLLPRLWEMMLDENQSTIVRNYVRESLLGKLFFEELRDTPVSQVLELLQHQEHAVQVFGAKLLALIEPKPYDFTLPQLVSLAHRPLAAIRGAACRMLEKLRVIWTPDLLVNVMETEWDDTREWAMQIVSSLPDEERAPELIYGLLDTARQDIRTLAMDLIRQHLEQLDISELMLRASESPYLEVQEFALTLAERLTWTAQRYSELELFFRTVFFRVHQGRRAKNLAFALLERLALQKKECAEAMVPLLGDLARNFGRQDFERILHLLTQIQVRYPDINTPLSLG